MMNKDKNAELRSAHIRDANQYCSKMDGNQATIMSALAQKGRLGPWVSLHELQSNHVVAEDAGLSEQLWGSRRLRSLQAGPTSAMISLSDCCLVHWSQTPSKVTSQLLL